MSDIRKNSLLVLTCCFLIMILFYLTLPGHSQEGANSNNQDWRALFVPSKSSTCRWDALNILLAKNGTISEDSPGMVEARKCWERDLVFYMSYPMDFTYGSHALPLLAALWVTQGPILELGSGWYSTPIIHRVSSQQSRFVLTAEPLYTWFKYFLFFASDLHQLYYVNEKNLNVDFDGEANVKVVQAFSDVGYQQQHWSFIFVDHEPPPQRVVDLKRLREKGDIFMYHDTEPKHDRIYGAQDILGTFKYRASFGPNWSPRTYTDVISDTRPDLISAVVKLTNWGMELLDELKDSM